MFFNSFFTLNFQFLQTFYRLRLQFINCTSSSFCVFHSTMFQQTGNGFDVGSVVKDFYINTVAGAIPNKVFVNDSMIQPSFTDFQQLS